MSYSMQTLVMTAIAVYLNPPRFVADHTDSKAVALGLARSKVRVDPCLFATPHLL